MSTHSVDVLACPPIEKHPNADTLGLIRIGGYTAAVRLGEFQEGDLIAYIEPDYVVPDTDQFAFLRGNLRIRAKRLRGVWSQGLVIPAPAGTNAGDNCMDLLGICRYNPPEPGEPRGPNRVRVPPQHLAKDLPSALATMVKYDLENWRKYGQLELTQGEGVVITEKIHGANSRYCFMNDRMWVGSRSWWWEPEAEVEQHKVLRDNPWIEEWCRAHPTRVLCGEVYGQQDLKYGKSREKLGFLAFDVYVTEPVLEFSNDAGYYVNAEFFADWVPEDKRVPVLFEGPYSDFIVTELAEEDSKFGGISEGVVVRPVSERWSERVGRVILKCVSNRYMERMK